VRDSQCPATLPQEAHPVVPVQNSCVTRRVEASPGVEPEVTRFADGALRRERREAVDPVRQRTG
jgi:hypothetical protein